MNHSAMPIGDGYAIIAHYNKSAVESNAEGLYPQTPAIYSITIYTHDANDRRLMTIDLKLCELRNLHEKIEEILRQQPRPLTGEEFADTI